MREASALRRQIAERCAVLEALSPLVLDRAELWRGAAGVAYALIDAGRAEYKTASPSIARRWIVRARRLARREAGFPKGALFLGSAGIHFTTLVLASWTGDTKLHARQLS